MGFRIASLDNLTFRQPVKIAGATFTCEFRVLDDERLKQLAEQGDLAFLDAVLSNWAGIEDEDGRPLPFCQEHIEALCRYAIARQALLRAYWEGIAQAAEGN